MAFKKSGAYSDSKVERHVFVPLSIEKDEAGAEIGILARKVQTGELVLLQASQALVQQLNKGDKFKAKTTDGSRHRLFYTGMNNQSEHPIRLGVDKVFVAIYPSDATHDVKGQTVPIAQIKKFGYHLFARGEHTKQLISGSTVDLPADQIYSGRGYIVCNPAYKFSDNTVGMSAYIDLKVTEKLSFQSFDEIIEYGSQAFAKGLNLFVTIADDSGARDLQSSYNANPESDNNPNVFEEDVSDLAAEDIRPDQVSVFVNAPRIFVNNYFKVDEQRAKPRIDTLVQNAQFDAGVKAETPFVVTAEGQSNRFDRTKVYSVEAQVSVSHYVDKESEEVKAGREARTIVIEGNAMPAIHLFMTPTQIELSKNAPDQQHHASADDDLAQGVAPDAPPPTEQFDFEEYPV